MEKSGTDEQIFIFNYTLKWYPEGGTNSHYLSSVDYLVMTAVLLLSVGTTIGRNLSAKWKESSEPSLSPSYSSRAEDTAGRFQVLQVGVTNAIPFVNFFCLFGLSGEVMTHGPSIIFFSLGIIISAILAPLWGSLPLLKKTHSLSHFLKKKFPRCSSLRVILVIISLLKYILTGALNLHLAAISIYALTDILSFLAIAIIALSALVCALVGPIQEIPEASLSRIWLLIITLSTIPTTAVMTSSMGGFDDLFAKANITMNWESFIINPWQRNSFLGCLALGLIFGLQTFVLSPLTLKQVEKMSKGRMYCSIVITSLFIVFWLFLGTWAGLCCLVEIQDEKVFKYISYKSVHQDALLGILILRRLGSVKGFRGFFVGSLLSSSISSMRIRCNQVISLIWSLYSDEFKKGNPRNATSSLESYLRHWTARSTGRLEEDFLKEVKYRDRASRRNKHFVFKVWAGLLFTCMSVGLTSALHLSSLGVWELWQNVNGITTGTALGVLLMATYFPCLSPKSIVVGMCVGFTAVSTLGIASTSINTTSLNYYQFHQDNLTTLETNRTLSNSVGYLPFSYLGVTSIFISVLTANFYILISTSDYTALKNYFQCKSPNNEGNELVPDDNDQEHKKKKLILSVIQQSSGI